jgi:hypothetical protein
MARRSRRVPNVALALLILAGSYAPASADPPAFPLKVAPGGRYLIDQRGHPFFIVGDSPQSIYANVPLAEADAYLAARQAQGFNAILADPTYDSLGKRARRAANGELAFLKNVDGGRYDGTLGTADFSTPNPRYWDYVDTVMQHAQDHGFLVMQYVVAWGYGGRGLWNDLINRANSEATCYAFGKFLGARFRDRANVIWIDGSDFNGDERPRAPDRTTGIERALAVLRGMRAAGALQLRTGDWMADSLSTDQKLFAPFMAINGVYAYGDKIGAYATYHEARLAYQHTPPLPVFLKETGYEAENLIPGDTASVRKYEWWAVLSGANNGLLYGHGAIWPFTRGQWQKALDAPGGHDVQRMGALMRGLAWQDLVPSGLAGMRRLVTSDNGSPEPPSPRYAAAAATPDGRLLLAYVPPFQAGAQDLTVDLRGMKGTLTAQWWDPTSAQTHPAGTGLGEGETKFTTPGANRAGANDWVLVVRSGG